MIKSLSNLSIHTVTENIQRNLKYWMRCFTVFACPSSRLNPLADSLESYGNLLNVWNAKNIRNCQQKLWLISTSWRRMCSQHLHKYPVSLQPNKTNAVDCEDYRTICLISHTYRILFIIIQEIIHNKNKSEVAEEQFGFGKNSGTQEAIFCLIIT